MILYLFQNNIIGKDNKDFQYNNCIFGKLGHFI